MHAGDLGRENKAEVLKNCLERLSRRDYARSWLGYQTDQGGVSGANALPSVLHQFNFFIIFRHACLDSRSEEVKTQIDTFKSTILLSTCYPVLRKIFIECTHSERISSASFKEAWTRPMDERILEWEFAFSLVISCLSENTLANLVEGTEPSLLGRTTELDSGHVDLLIPQLYS